MTNRQLDAEFIYQKLGKLFDDDLMQCMHSDANDEKQILRIRFAGASDLEMGEDDEEEGVTTAVQFLRKSEKLLLNEMTLKGFEKISRVYAKRYTITET